VKSRHAQALAHEGPDELQDGRVVEVDSHVQPDKARSLQGTWVVRQVPLSDKAGEQITRLLRDLRADRLRVGHHHRDA
jgi:hypothetical protein